MCTGRLRWGTNDGDNNHHARSNNDGSSHARGLGNSGSACGSRRDATRLARSGVYLDKRLLALDRSPVCVGPRHVDRASNGSGCLGGRSLGPSSRWLGVDRRPLAVKYGPHCAICFCPSQGGQKAARLELSRIYPAFRKRNHPGNGDKHARYRYFNSPGCSCVSITLPDSS